MTNEEVNQHLYEKLVSAQDRFRLELLASTPIEILRHAKEYFAREDIILCLEDHNLPDAQALALLKSKDPLGDIYARWECTGDHHMDDIRDTIHEFSAELARYSRAQQRNDSR